MSKRVRVPAHQTVVAYLALVIAITGGVAVAAGALKKNSVKSKHIAPEAVTGADVAEGTLGKVPASGLADRATAADSAITATRAESASTAARADVASTAVSADSASTARSASRAATAGSADSAASAANADRLDDLDSTRFLRSDQLGGFVDAGVPTTCSGWPNVNPSVNQAASYWRDPFGVVHLRGTVFKCDALNNTIFTLPAGFRPGKLEHFAVAAENDTPPTAIVNVGSNGQVVAPGSTDADVRSLDGITFRCEPPGSNGCP